MYCECDCGGCDECEGRKSAPLVEMTLELNPIGWKAPTPYVRRFGGKYSVGTSPAPEVAAYQEAVKEMSSERYAGPPIVVPVEIHWNFSRQLPSYVNEAGRKVTKHRQDLTNLVKAAEDAIQPHIIHNDVQVMRSVAQFDAPQSTDVTETYVRFAIYAY